MNPDALESIRDRFNAIIPGPWRWYGNTATDQVMLATTNRGRLFIMDTHTRTEEFVFDHNAGQGYDLEGARELVRDFCGAHEDSEVAIEPPDAPTCRCHLIQQFLGGELSPEEGHREYYVGSTKLTRGATVHPDLRFPDKSLGDRRNEHGGHMRSYRDSPRYEVLGELTGGFFRGYRTRAEYEAQTGKPAEDALYREDFCGLDQPEATFIEHAPEDIGYLLRRLEAAERAVDAYANYAANAMRGQATQGTADAMRDAAQAQLRWEATQ